MSRELLGYFVSLFDLLILNLFQMGLQASNFQSANRVVNATEYSVIEPREEARLRRRKGPINVLMGEAREEGEKVLL